MTDKPLDHECLSIQEARELLRAEFGLTYHPETLRQWARAGVLPFFKMNDANPKDPFLIRAKDLRTHIWNQQNRAIERATG